MLDVNKIYCGDCLEVMKEIDNNSVDLIIADPPSNIKKDSWDKIDNYLDWIIKVFKECERVLKDNGSFYWFHNQMPVISKIMNRMENETEFVFKSMITWEKYQTNKQYYGRNVLMAINNRHKRNYCSMVEYCLFYTFQEEFQGHSGIFDDMRKELNQERIKAGFKTFKEVNAFLGVSTNGGGMASLYFSEGNLAWELPTEEMYLKLQETGYFKKPYEELRKEYEELRYTFNFVDVDITRTWLYVPAKKVGHLTPKPIPLINNILLHSSNKDDLVLIPFVGSGNDCIACRELERNFIGIDISKKYCKIAEKRLVNIQKRLEYFTGGK